jgi:tRNA (Thr-GGU) A37 N-methylase
MVALRVPSLINGLVRKPCIESINQKVKKTASHSADFVCFTEVHKEIVSPKAMRGISTEEHVVLVLWFSTVETMVSS